MSTLSTDRQAPGASWRERRDWPKSAIRVAFGLIWLADAGFKWTPGFRSGFLGYLRDGAAGQPGWLHWWFTFWIDLQKGDPRFFAVLVAVIETLIGVALVLGLARKLTYIGGALFSFLIWATAEGFGGPYTAGSTDVGASIIYVVVFLSFLAISYQLGPSRYSLDAVIERRIGWWHRLAEVGSGLVSGVPCSPSEACEPATEQPEEPSRVVSNHVKGV